jgi:UDP-3-O-[3-hydroxymyristoyl] N-acetylglucosamine deacetylase
LRLSLTFHAVFLDKQAVRFLLRQQQTIAKPVAVEGFGFWSGCDVRVEFRPAAAGSGVRFVRADRADPPVIAATVANRVEVPRRTNLVAEDATVEMVEHVLAALAGLQIDNCEVWVDGAELPGCDGSSLLFTQAFDSVGRVRQSVVRQTLVVSHVTRLGNDTSWIEARPNPADGLCLEYDLDYGTSGPIGRQRLKLSLSERAFRNELAAARTFLLKAEADQLRAEGLGQRVTWGDLLVFDQQGPVQNALRFPNECVRHKMLDLIGDLALAGCDIQGTVSAYRSGHRLNASLVKQLLQKEPLVGENLRVA